MEDAGLADRDAAGGAMEGLDEGGPSGTTTKHPVLEHKLPLARVKRLIKAESDVTQLTAEAGALITKATELFLEKLATQAARHMVDDCRITLRYKDLSTTVAEQENLEFLQDIAPNPFIASQLPEDPQDAGLESEESSDEEEDEVEGAETEIHVERT